MKTIYLRNVSLSASDLEDQRLGPRWSLHEDQLLENLVETHGSKQWDMIATSMNQHAGINNRTAKMCENRWNLVLSPGMRKGGWTEDEDRIICEAVQNGVHRWSDVSKLLSGIRTGKQVSHFLKCV